MNLNSNLNHMHVYKIETLSDHLEHFDLKCVYQHRINQLLKLREFIEFLHDLRVIVPKIAQTSVFLRNCFNEFIQLINQMTQYLYSHSKIKSLYNKFY